MEEHENKKFGYHEQGHEEKGHQQQAQEQPQQNYQESQQHQQQQPHESEAERNWKKLREEARQAAEERDHYRKLAEEAEKKEQERQRQYDDDDYVEHRELKKQRQEIQRELVNIKVQSKYPDFDNVVTNENLRALAKEEPELATAIDQTQDLYAKAALAYKSIKRREIPSKEDDRQRMAENSQKPRSLGSLSDRSNDSPLNNAHEFAGRGPSEKEKDRLYAEMIQYADQL